jgi:hypothetical protein
VWEAFGELNYRRGVSMAGPVPITMADIEAYCRFRAIFSPYERDRFLIYLRALDQEWMTNHYTEKARNETGNKPTSPKTFNRQRT